VVVVAGAVVVVDEVVVSGTVVVVDEVVVVRGGTVMGGTVIGGTVIGGTVIGGTVMVVGGTVIGGTVMVDVVVLAGRLVLVDEVVLVAGTVVVVDEVVVVSGTHTGLVTVFESSVTAPFRANNRPWTVAFVFAVIDVKARMVPRNVVPTPRVAELPTCQKTLHGCAPLISSTLLLGAVMSVDPAWKTKIALGSPWASSVSAPVMANESAL
jgi:hypothetical protein